jgi:hypothetical protein
MATYDLQGPVIHKGNWIIHGIDITSASDRNKNTSDYFKVDVGIRKDGKEDFFGNFSQSTNALVEGTATSIMDEKFIFKRLDKGMTAFVRVTTSGSPATLVGTSVTFHLEQVGAFTGKPAPLINTIPSEDPATRLLVDQINQSGMSEFSHAVPLVDKTPVASDILGVATYMDRDSTGAAISATSFTDGSVSITVIVPTGNTVSVVVTATWQVEAASSGATRMWGAIGDGTTDHNETEVYTPGTGANAGGAATYAADITANTTFKLRLMKLGSPDALVEDQTITALAVAV